MLTDIFMIRMLNAKTHTAVTSRKVEVAKPIMLNAMARETKPVIIGPRVLNRPTSQLEMGSPTIELMGMKSRMVPNSASLKLKFVLIVGIREAHVEKQKPERKKKALKKMRCLDLDIIL